MKSYTAKQRLTVAMAGAAAAHLIFFTAGYFGINPLWIPSNEDRVLVLTLETTPLEGLKETELPADDTINDASAGAPKDIAPTQTKAEPNRDALSSQTEMAKEPQNDLEQEPLTEPIEKPQKPSIESISKPIAQISEELAQQTEPLTEPINPKPPSSDTDTLVKEPSAVSKVGPDSISPLVEERQLVLTSLSSEVSLLTQESAPSPLVKQPAPVTEIVPIDVKQKKMLDKKIKYWTENIGQLEDMPESLTWKVKGQTYVAKFSRLPASGEMDMDQISVEVITERDGNRLTTTMRMKKLAFSNFAQFVHRWDPKVSMHDDEMDGRFHSNSRINLDPSRSAQPIFHSKVTTASYQVNIANQNTRTSRKKIFRGGIETGVKKIRMPKPSLFFTDDIADKNNKRIFFEQDTRIIFNSDGHYLWQPVGEYIPLQRRSIGAQPAYLISAPGKTLYISGQVKGKVLVYSPKRIVIEDDLTYSNLASIKDGGDFLGIVSGGNIEIAKPSITSPGDLDIHASIYAKRRFAVKNYTYSNKGTLNILGSLTAGSMSATEPRYATKITFDKRLENLRPPGFPVTDRYELTVSNHNWKSLALPQPEQTPYALPDDIEQQLLE